MSLTLLNGLVKLLSANYSSLSPLQRLAPRLKRENLALSTPHFKPSDYSHLINLGASAIGMCAALISLAASAEPASVKVNVNGLRSQKGQVFVYLWRQQHVISTVQNPIPRQIQCQSHSCLWPARPGL
jgi:hypothetical protein